MIKHMDKKIKQDNKSIDISGGVSFSELTNRYTETVGELLAKYDNVHDIYVECESYEYNDGESHAQEIVIYYKRYETDEEYQKRVDWLEYRKTENEKADTKKLKELIAKYPDIAKDYINELNKI